MFFFGYTEAMSLDVKTSAKKTEITYEELSKLVDAGMLHLYDVREPADVNQTGVINSAINIPCMIITYFVYFLNYAETTFSELKMCFCIPVKCFQCCS